MLHTDASMWRSGVRSQHKKQYFLFQYWLEALEKEPLPGGWKDMNTSYSLVLCIPEAGENFQEKLACLDFFKDVLS